MSKENNLKDYLTDLYEGIATKKPDASRNPQNFRAEIESIETGSDPVLKNKTVTENGTYTASKDGADGYSVVRVDVPVPDGYIQPSGSVTITKNSTVDVTEKAEVVVNVPIPAGYIKPSGSITITENGNFDITDKESVTVAVEAGSGNGGSSECSLDHIHEVAILPMANISGSDLYKMGDTYYKYSDKFNDILLVYNGAAESLVELYGALGVTVELYYAKTIPTEDVKISSDSGPFYLYYVASEDDILAYGDLGGTGTNEWLSMVTSMGAPYGGAITSVNDATQENTMYALVEQGWKPLGAAEYTGEVVIE